MIRSALLATLLASPSSGYKTLRSGESRLGITELWAHDAEQYPVQTDFADREDESFVFTTGKVGDIFSIPSSIELAAMPAARVTNMRPSTFHVGDKGLTSVKTDPDFENHPYVYAFYSVQPSGQEENDVCATDGSDTKWIDGSEPYSGTYWCQSMARLSRFRLAKGEFGFSATEEAVLLQNWCSSAMGHQTGDILFLENGDMLVSAGDCSHDDAPDAGVGDAAALDGCAADTAIDPQLGKLGGVWRAQRDDSLCGKVIRIAQETYRRPSRSTAAPPASGVSGLLSAAADVTVVAKGLRNPVRMAVQDSGDVYVSEQGVLAQEINVIPDPTAANDADAVNFGWPCFEGTSAAAVWPAALESLAALDAGVSATFCRDLVAAAPTYAYTTALDGEGKCRKGQGAVTGLSFYYGGELPAAYQGGLFLTDANKDCLVVFTLNGNGAVTFSTQPTLVFYEADADTRPAMSDVRSGPNGALYIASPGYTTITKLTRGSANLPPVAALTLNDFTYEAGSTVEFDASPSSDPDETTTITEYMFDFGDGSDAVIVKAGDEPKVEHLYNETGIFKMSLTVQNSQGFTDVFNTALFVGVAFEFVTNPAADEWAVHEPLAYALTAEGVNIPEDAVTWYVTSRRCYFNPCTNQEDCFELEEKEYTKEGTAGHIQVPEDYDAPWQLTFRASLTGDSVGGLTGLTVGPFVVKPAPFSIVVGRTNNFNLDARVSTYSSRNNVQCTYADMDCKLTVMPGGLIDIKAPLIQAYGGDVYKFHGWLVNGAEADGDDSSVVYNELTTYAPLAAPEDGDFIVNATYVKITITDDAEGLLKSKTLPVIDLAITKVQASYGNIYVAFNSINRMTGRVADWPADFYIINLVPTRPPTGFVYPHSVVVPQQWTYPVPSHQQDITIKVPGNRLDWSVSISAFNLKNSYRSPNVASEDKVTTAAATVDRNSQCADEPVCSVADGDVMCSEAGVLDAGDVFVGLGLYYDANCAEDSAGFVDGCGAGGGALCRLCFLDRCLYQKLHTGTILDTLRIPDCPPCVAYEYKDVALDSPVTGTQRNFLGEVNAAQDPTCDCVGDSCYSTVAPTPAPTAPTGTGSDFCDMPPTTEGVKCQYLASQGDVEDGVTLVYDPACLEGVGRLGCRYTDGFGTRPECRYCIYDECKYKKNRGLADFAANEFLFCGGTSDDSLGADCIFEMGGLPYINKEQDYACSSPAPTPSLDATPGPTTTYSCSGGYLDDICAEGSAVLLEVDVTSDMSYYLAGADGTEAVADSINGVVLCPGEYYLRVGTQTLASDDASPNAVNWTATVHDFEISGHAIDSTTLYVGGYAPGLPEDGCWAKCRKANYFCDACTTFAAMFGAPGAPPDVSSPCDCEAADADAAIAKSACMDAGCDADEHCGGLDKSAFTVTPGSAATYRALIGSIDTNAVAMYSQKDLLSAVQNAAASWLAVDSDEVEVKAINGYNATEFADYDMKLLNDAATNGYLRVAVYTDADGAADGSKDQAGLAAALAPSAGFANCAVLALDTAAADTFYVDSVSDPRGDGKKKKKQIGGMGVGAVVGICIAGLLVAAIAVCVGKKAVEKRKAQAKAGAV